MGKRQKRFTPHAEGEHGPRTHAQIQRQLTSSPAEPSLEEVLDEQRKHAAVHGKRRLVADREQRDAADKDSERTRLFREARRDKTIDAPGNE